MRRPVTDIALLAFIAKRRANVISYSEATEACKSSSSASRALHQLIQEGMIEPQPKLVGLRYVTQYAVTPKGKQVSELALHLTELRGSSATKTSEKAPRTSKEAIKNITTKKMKRNAEMSRKSFATKARKDLQGKIEEPSEEESETEENGA
jgi:DNA-binding MarR family transcriptional regulator